MKNIVMPKGSGRRNFLFDLFIGKAEKTEEESAFVAESQFKPFNPDDLYQKRGSHEIYTEMLDDEQVWVALQLKKDLVLGAGWDIIAQDDDQEEIVADLEMALGEDPDVPLTENLEEILSAYEYGFSLTEKIFKMREDNSLALRILKTRHPDTWLIHTDKHGNVTRFEQQGIAENLDINPRSLIHYVNNRKFQNAYGRSDLRSAYYAYFAKRHVTRYYAIFLEKAASPTPVARYGTNVPDAVVTKIFNIIKKFQSRTAMAIPKDVELEFLESKSDGEAFIKGINIFNMFIGRSLFIPDLIGLQGSDSGGGSRALGTEQISMFLNHIRRRKTTIEGIVNKQLVEPIVHFNHGLVENFPKFVLKPVTDDDAIKFAEVFIQAMKGSIYKPTEEEINHFRNLIKFPEGDVEFAEPVVAPGFPPNSSDKPEKSSGQSGHLDEDKNTGHLDEDEDKAKAFAHLESESPVFNDTEGDFGDKVNFNGIRAKMQATSSDIVEESKPIIDTIFTDLLDQIEKKKILKNQRIDRIDDLKVKNLKKIQLIIKSNFRKLFNDSQVIANNEILRSNFVSPILSEDFLDFLEKETFQFIGDWSFNITKEIAVVLREAIKDGKPLSSVIDFIEDNVGSSAQVSLERFSRTKSTEVLNRGRLAAFENSGIVTGVQYSAILDDRTTVICAGLHGKQFTRDKAPIPPLHFNCRSVLIPITRFETLTPDTRVGGTVSTRRGKDIKVPNREIESFIEEFKGKGFSKQ